MARPKQIRITQNDRKEYERLARKTKGKIARTKRKYGVDLGNEIKVPKLDDFTSRKEFNEWKEKAETITNRYNLNYQFKKNDYGVVATMKEISEIKRNTIKAQREVDRRNKRIEQLPYYEKGKKVGTVGQEMKKFSRPTQGFTRPNDFDFKKVRTRSDFNRRKENMKKKASPRHYNERMTKMHNSYITMMETLFNGMADDVVESLKMMNPDDFYDLYLQNETYMGFEYIPCMENNLEIVEGVATLMRDLIERYMEDENRGLLKDF